MGVPEEGRQWLRQAIEALDEEPPHPDAIEAVRVAFVDRVFAHAERCGLLERVTHPPGSTVIVHPPDSPPRVVVPGDPVVVLDGGRAYLLAVADG